MSHIEREKAIEVLERLKKDRERTTCRRSAIIEAKAFAYAIEIIKQIPDAEESK